MTTIVRPHSPSCCPGWNFCTPQGTINSFELNELIHNHHQGPSRELWSRYSNVRAADMVVAAAVVDGLIKQEEVPAEVFAAISRQLAFYQSLQEREERQEPEP